MSRTVVRNSFARQTIVAERVYIDENFPMPSAVRTAYLQGCGWCGCYRITKNMRRWLYRFLVEDDQGPRHSGPISDGKLFCSRDCAESWLGSNFNEVREW